jgi:hypothetical protein
MSDINAAIAKIDVKATPINKLRDFNAVRLDLVSLIITNALSNADRPKHRPGLLKN